MLFEVSVGALAGLVSGLIAAWLLERTSKGADYRKLAELDARIYSLEEKWISLRNRAGQERQGELKAEEAEFMTQAAAIFQGEGDMKSKIIKIYALNPQLAMKFAGKFMQGKI